MTELCVVVFGLFISESTSCHGDGVYMMHLIVCVSEGAFKICHKITSPVNAVIHFMPAQNILRHHLIRTLACHIGACMYHV